MIVQCQTRARADWLIQLLRPHPAFRGGTFDIDIVETISEHTGRFRVVYLGPRVHRSSRVHMEPLVPDGEFFDDRAEAERECARINRGIPANELSAVHVEDAGDGGPWYLLWIAAAVQHPGDEHPTLPERPTG